MLKCKTFYILFLFSLVHFYFYLALLFILIVPNKNNMRVIFYKKYGTFMDTIFYLSGLKAKIKDVKVEKVKIDGWRNLIILNHCSAILDNLVLAHFLRQNNFDWNNLRTVSRISKKKTSQNKILSFFDSLLLTKNLKHDQAILAKTLAKWHNTNLPLNIVLFPEGVTFEPGTHKKYGKNYKNVLAPKSGLFQLLIKGMRFKHVYSIDILYKLKNRRLSGDKDILFHMADPDFTIVVQLHKTDITKINEEWIYSEWIRKDKWITESI